MSWESIILDSMAPGEPLGPHIDRMFAQQRESWPALREGESALSTLRTKLLRDGDARVIVQSNPLRKPSIYANNDPQAVARRPCFLCPQNMPREERGLGIDPLVVLPNPNPVLARHCTVVHREHRPQRLAGHLGALLQLARAVGPEMIVFYNGPQCGASAPDHFHFQAADACQVPLVGELPVANDGLRQFPHESFGRRMLVSCGADAGRIEAQLERTVRAIGSHQSPSIKSPCVEPVVSLVTLYRAGRYSVVLFPRARHRPSCYFAEGDARLAISPASLEMAGVLIVVEPKDFDRVDAAAARSIYEEVSFDRARFNRLCEEVL